MKKLPIASCSVNVAKTLDGEMVGIMGYTTSVVAAKRIVESHRKSMNVPNGFEAVVRLVSKDDVCNCAGIDYIQYGWAKK